MLLVVVPLGARWFSRLFYLEHKTFLETLRVWEGGGLVFYGGMLFGVVGVLVYARVRHVHLPVLLDILAPALALGLACGRVGCFLAGCCWGDVCLRPQELAGLTTPLIHYQVHSVPVLSTPAMPLAVRFPKGSRAFEQHQKLGLISAEAVRSLPVHPVQLYEALLTAALALVLTMMFARPHRLGTIFCGLLCGYACIRFITEFFRADNQPVYFGLTLSQVISVILGLMGWILVSRIVQPFRTTATVQEQIAALETTVARGREQR
jgi:phosphatidylglycerol---prolipoprotein diacylglyceryl transferase